ncbi:MAG: hypothetical protein QNJ94_06810 [Alphaproteobacteria bacterium]|nr:hypothetical protein [Alphaproteobacteria bacterium]
MYKAALLFAAVGLLAACETPQQASADPIEFCREQKLDPGASYFERCLDVYVRQRCQRLGYTPGTDAFRTCLWDQRQQTAARDQFENLRTFFQGFPGSTTVRR